MLTFLFRTTGVYGFFACSCGMTAEKEIREVERGRIKYCSDDCGERPATTKQRESGLFNRWRRMIYRCNNEKSSDYKYYGGRGISVCIDWLSFGNFVEWCSNNGYSPELQLDRKDNNKGYSPDNCRFVTSLVNNNNKNR
jgi:hypothetical protein